MSIIQPPARTAAQQPKKKKKTKAPSTNPHKMFMQGKEGEEGESRCAIA